MRVALQLSLNIPVVALSDRLGPNRIYVKMHGFAATTACCSPSCATTCCCSTGTAACGHWLWIARSSQ